MNKTDQPTRICAIDASTNSLAYAVFDNKDLKEIGKINFEGNDIYLKIGDAARKTKAYFEKIMADFPKTKADFPKTKADFHKN